MDALTKTADSVEELMQTADNSEDHLRSIADSLSSIVSILKNIGSLFSSMFFLIIMRFVFVELRKTQKFEEACVGLFLLVIVAQVFMGIVEVVTKNVQSR